MSSLKYIIEDFVNEQYSNSTESEKSLLKSLSLKKAFSLPYYRDMYYSTSVCTLNDNDAYFATNKYDLDSGDYMPLLHSVGDKYPDFSLDFDDAKAYLLDPAVISRLDTFFHIVKNHSSNIQDYTDKIIEAQKGDNEFLSTINSFNYVIPNYEYLFFNSDTDSIFHEKGVETVYSKLCKNETYIASSFSKKCEPDIVNNRWLENHKKREESIEKAESMIFNIHVYYDRYQDQLKNIEQHIKSHKPYLFETTQDQHIEFSYYETKGLENNGTPSFGLEKDTCFDEETLNKNGIIISDVYSLIPNEEKYETLQEVVLKHLMKKDDDISTYLPSRFYGLDFLNENALHPSSKSKSYLIAKSNNDVVGLFSLNSTDVNGKSVIKNIGYVCVKDNFRGTGLVEKMYDKIASICVDNNNIVVNSHYTEQGRYKLPKLKQRVRERHPDFLLLDTDLGQRFDASEHKRSTFTSKEIFNEFFHFELNDLEISSPEKLRENTKAINKIHKESMNYIDNHRNAFCHDEQRIVSLVSKKLINRQKLKVRDLLNNNTIKQKIKI